jgi:hypothetical protein
MKKNLLFTALIIFTLASCTKKPGTLTGNVYWKYNNYVGNKPDAGSEVKLYSRTDNQKKYETTTDVSGNFKIEDITPGNYFLVVQSHNTTDSPKDHLDNLLIHADNMKNLFGLDLKTYKKELDEITKLEGEYHRLLTETNSENSYDALSRQINAYQKVEDKIKENSIDLISKFPLEFKTKLGLLTGYDESFNFSNIEIKKAKTANQNIDFGLTYN